jgi:hypothetical protein
MKRLRTLSIKNPHALALRNVAQPWGEAFWRNHNLRKRREWQLRQIRRQFFLVPVIAAPETLPGEVPLEDAVVVH